MKKYLLCLDESGTFNEQEILDSNRNKRKCIVGGILIGNYSRLWNEKIQSLFTSWRTDYPERIRNKLYHAVEMGRIRGAEYYTEQIFDELHSAGIDFVIFEDDIDAYIVDSNTTYLNLLSEGIVQLLHVLSEKEGKGVELGVVVGRRANTSGNTGIFSSSQIEDAIYEQKINERLAIEKAKCGLSVFCENKIYLRMVSDKDHEYMMLADHVCHFWFSRESKKYRRTSRSGDDTISNKLQKYYNSDYIFPFLSSEQDNYVRKLISNGTYADALFEYCLGNLNSKNKNLVLKKVIGISDLALSGQLDNLVNYINNMIEVQRDLDVGETLLKNTNKVITALKNHGHDVLKFEIDVKLLLLAVYNHKARLGAMSELFSGINQMIKEYTEKTSDINYYLMTQNRYAVYLQDVLEYKKSINTCDEAIEVVTAIQKLIKNIAQHKIETGNEEFKSVQYGKLLGTKLQAYTKLVEDDKDYYEEAVRISDLAIEQFSMPMDIDRQYQYRAVLEAAGENYYEAIIWLEKYYGMKWDEYLSEKRVNPFGIMNLLHCADYMSRSNEDFWKTKAIEIAEKTCERVMTDKTVSSEWGYPEVCSFYYIGSIMMNKGAEYGKPYLKRVIKHASSHAQFVYQIMALKARLLLIKGSAAKGKGCESDKKKFDTLYNRMIGGGLSDAAAHEIRAIYSERCAL